MASLADLPADVLLKIIALMPLNHAKLELRRVSKTWKSLLASPEAYSTATWDEDQAMLLIPKLTQPLCCLRVARFDSWDGVGHPALRMLQATLSSSLVLRSCPSMPHLTHLDLSFSSFQAYHAYRFSSFVESSSFPVAKFPALTELHLHFAPPQLREGPALSGLQQLEHIHVPKWQDAEPLELPPGCLLHIGYCDDSRNFAIACPELRKGLPHGVAPHLASVCILFDHYLDLSVFAPYANLVTVTIRGWKQPAKPARRQRPHTRGPRAAQQDLMEGGELQGIDRLPASVKTIVLKWFKSLPAFESERIASFQQHEGGGVITLKPLSRCQVEALAGQLSHTGLVDDKQLSDSDE
ncbi:hypothetical protein WJX72_000586 [[Myrmecia] bisecta]|uniref:F-box domain-containing protein n=1 Tax=[Myrmecia] bisecta TaxID=41462 RepID=A0AAW1P5V5_9CHLO